VSNSLLKNREYCDCRYGKAEWSPLQYGERGATWASVNRLADQCSGRSALPVL